MKDIILIQRIFPKYRKDIFESLHQRIDFLLLHSRNKSGIKQATSSYARQIGSFQYSSNETNLFLNVIPHLVRFRPKVIIHEFSLGIASLMPTYMLARLLGIKFVLWGHGFDYNKGFHPESSLADKWRLQMLKKADAVIFYGSRGKEKIAQYVPKEKLFVAYNCLNTESLSAIRDALQREGREAVKQRIGFKHKYNLIFIGRMLASKKPELLIGIFNKLKARYGTSLSLHFVGDGPHLDHLKDLAKSTGIEDNVVFHGSIHDNERTGAMLYASDLMIMPGYVGLSVNHAFNFDCPVMTFVQKEDGPFHSPEIEYLLHEKTGFIVEEHSVEALADTVENYLADQIGQQQMKENIRNMVEHTCSIHRFIQGFEDAIRYTLK